MSAAMRIVGCALLALLPFLLPSGDAPRLASLTAYQMLDLETTKLGDGTSVTAAQLVLDSTAFAETGTSESEDGARAGTLRLGEVRILDEGGAPQSSEVTLELRRSLARGLRQYASEERGVSLAIEGASTAADGGVDFELRLQDGRRELAIQRPEDAEGDSNALAQESWRAPDRSAILPPLIAIALAILFRQPLIALLAAVVFGAGLVRMRGNPHVSPPGPALGADQASWQGTIDVGRHYFYDQFVDGERYMIILFVMFMLAMVGILTRSGGIQGMMGFVKRFANSARSTQISTFAMGLAIFFDDYANTILVGSTMRPITDRFRIAREKLAYIVDSTAAPVAGLSIFSTWIAFEVSTYSHQLPAAGLSTGAGYAVFVDTLPYRFYCILALLFVLFVTVTGRDFGPMLGAERRARKTGQLVREGGQPLVSGHSTSLEPAPGMRPSAWLALVPLGVFIFGTLALIAHGGGAFEMPLDEALKWEGITGILGRGSGSRPLMLGSLAGLVLAAILAAVRGLGLGVFAAAWAALRSMFIAIAILYLAWMIGAVCGDLGTAPYLTALLSQQVAPPVLPALLFLLAGAVAFSTGSSWSTMSILLPLVIGLAFHLGESIPIGGYGLMILCIGAVLEGSIFGDHCSPISDTTVLSSIASASDHIDHVRTQAPYALATMAVALLAGYLPCGYFGLNPWIGITAGAAVLLGSLLVFGQRADSETKTA